MIIDCDANATYAPDELGKELISQALSVLGNPSSLHRIGQRAKVALDDARDAVRALVGVADLGSRYRVVFTSGASEGNNTVVASCAESGAHIVSSQIEHPCVLAPLRRVQERGVSVAYAPTSSSGEVLVDAAADLVQARSTLLSVMAANNETGVMNDLRRLSGMARERATSLVVHSDAAQVLGKVPFSMVESGVDIVTVSGHKFGALPGVGALVIREGIELAPLILGGAQEEKLRGGTENVLGIVHMGLVARRLADALEIRTGAMRAVRDAFEARLQAVVPDVQINGSGQARLPNTSSVFIPGLRADDLVVALDLSGILVSAGAACSSGKPEPSHVLLAMGQSVDRVKSTVRVSFRADQDPSTGVKVADAIARVVTRVRGAQG